MGTNTIIPTLVSLEKVRAAAERARPHVMRTPLTPVEGALLKLECLQPTGSFKVRGFFAAALALPHARLRSGLITVSGGALISGVASALKGSRPDIEVIGVQSDGYALWPRVLAGERNAPIKPETIADGTTAPFDPRMFELMKECVDRWLIVPEPRLKAAIPEIAATAKVVAEGAGALPYAALEQLEPGPITVAVVSGGNIDPTLLASLLR